MAKRKSKQGMVYQLKITLMDFEPVIWRRVQVKGGIRLRKLHSIIQAVMGWEDYHLHKFEIGGIEYSVPFPGDMFDMEMEDERRVTLGRLAPEEGDRFLYEYDFGDSWEHEILVEKILPPDPKVRYPICLEGERACPPEDVGGVWGYEEFLEAIKNPDHSEHEDYLEWVGERFDPEEFDLEKTNKELRSVR